MSGYIGLVNTILHTDVNSCHWNFDPENFGHPDHIFIAGKNGLAGYLLEN